MIDLTSPKDTNRVQNRFESEDFLMLCWLVAGKTAFVQNKKFYEFKKELFTTYPCNTGLFEVLIEAHKEDRLVEIAKKVRLGKYSLLTKFVEAVAEHHPIDFTTVSLDFLETLPGIGMKSSRFFLLNSAPKQRGAILDTHLVKFLNSDLGLSLPSKLSRAQYLSAEQSYLDYCDNNKLDPVDLDLQIWARYARKPSTQSF